MKNENYYNGRSTEFKKPGFFRVYDAQNELVSSSQFLIDAENDLKSINGGHITLKELNSGMETLIKTEVCKDGTLAKWVRLPSGLVVIEFSGEN